MCFDSFGVLESNGIHHRILSNKSTILVGNWGTNNEEAIGNMQMDASSQKAMHFINLIKQRLELALTAREADDFLRRRA